MSHPEIDSVRVYQSVTFEKKNETYFASRKINLRAATEISINEEIGGVEIKSEKDHILVPFTNISCIYFKSPIKVAQDEKNKSVKEVAEEQAKIRKNSVKRPK